MLESKERAGGSYLSTKNTEELSKSTRWHKFVKECIEEHGYSWYYFVKQQKFGKHVKLNYSKKRSIK